MTSVKVQCFLGLTAMAAVACAWFGSEVEFQDLRWSPDSRRLSFGAVYYEDERDIELGAGDVVMSVAVDSPAAAQWRPEQRLAPETTTRKVCPFGGRGIVAGGSMLPEFSLAAAYGPWQSQSDELRPASVGVIIAEAGGAVLVGAAAGIGVGYLFVYNEVPFERSEGYLDFSALLNFAVGGAVGYTVGCPLGTWGVGAIAKQEGKFLHALLGSTIGTATALGIGLLFSSAEVTLLTLPILSAAGAVIGYNHSLLNDEYGFSSGGRLKLPGLAVRQDELPDRSRATVYDARLVTVKF